MCMQTCSIHSVHVIAYRTPTAYMKQEHGRALHLEVVLLSVVASTSSSAGVNQLAELALRLRLGFSLLPSFLPVNIPGPINNASGASISGGVMLLEPVYT